MAFCQSSHKASKQDKQDMLGTAEEEKKLSFKWSTNAGRPTKSSMLTPHEVSRINQGQWTIGIDGKRASQVNPCYYHDLVMNNNW